MNPTDTKKPFWGLIHAVAWAILFGIPFFSTGREENVTLEDYLHFVVIPLSFMAVFYTDYFCLIEKYLFKRQTGKFILSNLLLIAAVILAGHLLIRYVIPHTQPKPPRPERSIQDIVLFFAGNATLYSLVAGLSVAIRMTGGWYRTESKRRELEKSNFEAELKNLKSQLNPHFLFNTLNNIYSLIAFSPEKAQEAVHDLSKLLRYVLYENNQHFVPLEKEMEFIRNYVELMRIRLPEQVDVRVTLPEKGFDRVLIAPLLFISLIENAFKHGVSNSKPSFIHIALRTEEGKKIVCTIQNSYFPKDSQDKSGSGIGLVNLQKRLDLLYPDRYTLRCERIDDLYLSGLILNLNNEEP